MFSISEPFLVISGPWIPFWLLLMDWSEKWYSWIFFWSSWGLSGLAGALLLGLLVSAAAFWGFLALSGGFLRLSWASWGLLGSLVISVFLRSKFAFSLRFPSDFCVLAL